jgi:Protein of unknown function (DUF2505)
VGGNGGTWGRKGVLRARRDPRGATDAGMAAAAGGLCNAGRVKFEFEQRWTATAADVVEVYLDESFWAGLTGLSATSPPEVLSVDRDADRAVVRLHYVLSVDLPKEAARFIDPDDVAWIEETTWDLSSQVAQVAFQPDQAAKLLRASATATLTQDGDDAVRAVRGEVKVHIPLLGSKVEKVIVEGVHDHLDEETEAVRARLG